MGLRRKIRFLVVAVMCACAGPLVAPSATGAATVINVNTTVDELNNDGDCSLREATRAANLDAPVSGCPAGNGADTIRLGAAVYRLTIPGAQEHNSLTGDLDLKESVTITGAGRGATSIDGNAIERILDVFAPASVTVNDLEMRNGKPAAGRRGGAIVVLLNSSLTLRRTVVRNNRTADGPDRIPDGGAIYNNGTMTIIGSDIRNNVAGGNEGSGGGIWNSGTMNIQSSRIRDNTANGSNAVTFDIDGGGGIYNVGTLTMTTGTISGNVSRFKGGGIANEGTVSVSKSTINDNTGTDGGGISTSGKVTLTDSTLSNNHANLNGGGVWSAATNVTLANVTAVANDADNDDNGSGDGGAVFVAAGTVFTRNSMYDVNKDFGGQAPGCRVAAGAKYSSQGYNRFGGVTGCVVTGNMTGNIIGGAANLGPLANNGGPTMTHAVLAGSVAIDSANPAAPGSGGNACPATDQRGVARPRDGNGDAVIRCDMGSFER